MNYEEHYYTYSITNSDNCIESVIVKIHGDASIDEQFEAFKRFLYMAGYSASAVDNYFFPLEEG